MHFVWKGRDYKLITEVTQSGDDFSWTQIYPTDAKVTNKFTIGKECDMETIGGKKFKATVSMEGGKLSVTFPNYHHTSEISGGKLVEVNTLTHLESQEFTLIFRKNKAQ
uniref:Fatty acid binding protein 6, ileal (gastrotropin) n=1 Tax=Seriola lalandi dorsalis TaxID=1841481 RepID=A0A3B4XC69_SERLL